LRNQLQANVIRLAPLVVGSAALLGWLLAASVPATAAASAEDDDAAYTRTITERADKIVAPLEIADADKAARVRDLIAAQYRSLREVHDALDSKIAETKKSPGDKDAAEAYVGVAKKDADLKLNQLHRQFVARLSAELTPEQVEKVKDGLTYDVLHVTYRAYMDMLPTLAEEHKREIIADLVEAREYAMDAGSSKEKHAWFDKYKGRINNYLSKAGINMKQAEKDWAERRKAAQQTESK
jgi:uncharacterized protein DUF3826